VAWCDTLDLEILRGVASKLENFSGEVFQDRGEVDCCLSSDARLLAGNSSEVALYATAWELQMTPLVPRHTLARIVIVLKKTRLFHANNDLVTMAL
jgi:hypothetical protein